jgi:hypothetical protein
MRGKNKEWFFGKENEGVGACMQTRLGSPNRVPVCFTFPEEEYGEYLGNKFINP